MLSSNTWNYLTVCKQMSSNNSFKNKLIYKLFAYKSFMKRGFGFKYSKRVDMP